VHALRRRGAETKVAETGIYAHIRRAARQVGTFGRNRQTIVSDISDDPDLDRLMERIRGELAQRRVGDGEALPGAAPPGVLAPLLPPASSWADQITIDPTRRHYAARELLRLQDAAFLRAAYLAVLGREPDQAGWSVTLTRLRRSESSRVEVLHSLVTSVEGRARGAVITGLAVRLFGERIARLPGLRTLVAAASALRLLRQLPLLRARQEELEAELARMRRRHEQLAALVEEREAPAAVGAPPPGQAS